MSTSASYLRRGALTLAIVTVCGFLTNYVFELGLARFLSPHAYGDFKVAYSFAYFCGLAVLLGGDRAAPMVLSPYLERGEPRRVWEYLRFYLGSALLLALGLVAVTWTVSYLHVGKLDPHHHHPLAWVVLAVPINAAGAMISRTLQSARRPAQAVIPWRIGLPLLELALFGLVIGFKGDLGILEAILIATVATATITTGQWLWVRRLGLVEMVRDPALRQGRLWLAGSLPMMGSFLVALALGQSDLYLLEILGDEAEVGHYAAGATAAHLIVLVQTTIIGLVAPIARPAIEAGAQRARTVFRQAHMLMLGSLIPISAILFLFAVPVLALFGPEYGAARVVFLCLVIGNFAWATAAISSLWLQYQHRGTGVLAISIGALIFDSALNVILIPRYGMNGAAASTACTLSGAAIAIFLLLYRQHQLTIPDPPTEATEAPGT